MLIRLMAAWYHGLTREYNLISSYFSSSFLDLIYESPSKDKCIVRALYLWANALFQCMFKEIRLDRI